MMNNGRRRAIVVLAIAALAGCASQPRVTEKASQLRPGVSTKADAVQLLGKPRAVSAAGNGELLQWIDQHGPFSASMDHVAILFDQSGRMVRVTHRYETP